VGGPDLPPEMVIARLFLISDVLFNSNSGAAGASRYRTCFEDLLPDAFERLGRIWLPCIDRDGPQSTKAESAAQCVVHAWRSWDVFPSVFIDGLESLLLSPAPESTDALRTLGPEHEVDAVLRQKLAWWVHEVSPAELKVAAKRRGLSGGSLPVVACRLRFCHYERYWHRLRLEEAANWPVESPCVVENECSESSSDGDLVFEAGSIDGESLDDEEFSTLDKGLEGWPANVFDHIMTDVVLGESVSSEQLQQQKGQEKHHQPITGLD